MYGNKFYIVLPCYNEENYIGNLLESLKNNGYKNNIIVIDDGSTDRTLSVLKKFSIHLHSFSKNRGKGAALRKGMEIAFQQYQSEFVILMDSDGQHAPEDIKKFIELYQQQKPDIIIGTRMHNISSMPLIRKIANKCMSKLLSFISGISLTDSQSGFRLINRKAWEVLKLKSNHYEIESEMILSASKHSLVIKEVPIKTLYEGQKSKIKPLPDTIRFLKLLINYYISK